MIKINKELHTSITHGPARLQLAFVGSTVGVSVGRGEYGDGMRQNIVPGDEPTMKQALWREEWVDGGDEPSTT